MQHAESVTFGGSGLDRAAALRGDDAALANALARSDSRTILLWRGKILLEGDALVRLPMDHPVLRHAQTAPIFLGREGNGHCFAHDISAWQPVEIDEAQIGAFLDQSEQNHPELSEAQCFCELRAVMTQLSARDAELSATAKALFGWHKSHGFCANCGAESQVSMAGWQRDCPACGRRHFPRTDPVVIMLITRGNNVLVGRSPGWPEGVYSLLAGFMEPGETLEAAVRREVAEETAVKVGPVRYLASQPWAFPSSLMIGCHGEALNETITIDPVEIEDARWVSREEMMTAMAGDHPELRPAREGAIAHFLLRNWLADRLD